MIAHRRKVAARDPFDNSRHMHLSVRDVTELNQWRKPKERSQSRHAGEAAWDDEEEVECVTKEVFTLDREAALNAEGKRLDVVLCDRFEQSRNYFEAIITKGAVRVNGKVKKRSFRKLKEGDVVSVRFLLDERTLPLAPEPIPLEVLYEDEDLMVINKPPGLVVHPAPGHWNGTLVNAVMHHLGVSTADTLPKPAGPTGGKRAGIVHRLDMNTSGLITVTKTDRAFTVISEAFARREVHKVYLAVAAGNRQPYRDHPDGGGHVIDFPIGRSPIDGKKMAIVEEAAGGRASLSMVRSIAEDKDICLLEVRPRTGRTHQIRVHLSAMKTPVLGDPTYGGEARNRQYRMLAQRPLLHAHKLSFKHPTTREQLNFVAPMPEDMRALVRRMEPNPDEAERLARLLSEPLGEGGLAAPAAAAGGDP